MKLRTTLLLGALAIATPFACSVYDPSLLGAASATSSSGTRMSSSSAAGTGGASTTSTSGASTASSSDASTAGTGGGEGGAGGAKSCDTAGACPGVDTDCKVRACKAGVCSFDYPNMGTSVSASLQTPNDCAKVVCDGNGGTTSVVDDTDTPNDMNDCTVDACMGGVPAYTQKVVGSPCNQNSGKCAANAKCVECLSTADCTDKSLVCDLQTFKCIAATCADKTKNGYETDVDCGGKDCPKCAPELMCSDPADCMGGVCPSGVCLASCTDGSKNNGETDIDCGGPNCTSKCDVGKSCSVGADCKTGSCVAGTCACANDHLLISEVRSRGIGAASDEFVELYNPTTADVKLDASWKLEARSHTAGAYGSRWVGDVGKTIPAHGHYLIAGSGYKQMPVKDDDLSTSITDATCLRLMNTVSGVTPVDAVCYGYNATVKSTLMSAGYDHEGTPANNLPHNDSAGNTDSSIQRLPGGALGSCIDTGVNAADFVTTMPALPQNTMSATTP